MHSSERMRALVNDVASYPEFLPWCSNAEVLERCNEFMLASIVVQKGGMRQSFTTKNDISVEGKILMNLVDGPFSSLNGVWDFIYLQENACKVELNLSFEIKRNIAKVAFSQVFNQAANSMVGAFCDRANEIYC